MDTGLIQQLFLTATDIKFVAGFLAALFGATAFGWLKEYFGTKGKNYATRQDVIILRDQLEVNTKTIKKIEQEYSREDFLWRSELSYREQQLSELYGPAYGYLKSQRDIYDMWMGGHMRDVNFEIKDLFAKQNSLLRELLVKKAHLIEGPFMPDSFVRFCTSTIVFDLYAAPTNDGTVPEHLANNERAKYPNDFNDHIIETTEFLKRRLSILRSKYAASE